MTTFLSLRPQKFPSFKQVHKRTINEWLINLIHIHWIDWFLFTSSSSSSSFTSQECSCDRYAFILFVWSISSFASELVFGFYFMQHFVQIERVPKLAVQRPNMGEILLRYCFFFFFCCLVSVTINLIDFEDELNETQQDESMWMLVTYNKREFISNSQFNSIFDD